ncbi:hypothetical protein SAY86_008985 [Trapa natans]|uniref:Uncharacterized protein n=1 Tax=Trapa natans TaxID=22666 RepID=A0AAN7QBW8_TRANT|nr:hypothetical protein SAY86_008985 [Trapa natans]
MNEGGAGSYINESEAKEYKGQPTIRLQEACFPSFPGSNPGRLKRVLARDTPSSADQLPSSCCSDSDAFSLLGACAKTKGGLKKRRGSSFKEVFFLKEFLLFRMPLFGEVGELGMGFPPSREKQDPILRALRISVRHSSPTSHQQPLYCGSVVN